MNNQEDKTSGIKINETTESGLKEKSTDKPMNEATSAQPQKETPRWNPSRERVESWAVAKSINHYEVLEVDENADDSLIESRIEALDKSLERWAMDMMDANTQRIGSKGKDFFHNLRESFKDRVVYNLQIERKKKEKVIQELRNDVDEFLINDMVLQWDEWSGIKRKANELGLSEELETILQEWRSKGAITGLQLKGKEREARTLNEIRDICNGNGLPLVEPMWNGELETWLEKAAEKDALANEVRNFKEAYRERKISGALLFLWEIGEKRLPFLVRLGDKPTEYTITVMVKSIEQWVDGIQEESFVEPSLQALQDGRLENWFGVAMNNKVLSEVAAKMRLQGDTDLKKLAKRARTLFEENFFEIKPVKLSKGREIRTVSDLVSFIENDSSWQKEFDAITYNRFLEWVDEVKSKDDRITVQELISYYNSANNTAQEKDIDYTKEALLRFFTPERSLILGTDSFNIYTSTDIENSVKSFIEGLDEIWKVTNLKLLGFYLFQLEFSLRQREEASNDENKLVCSSLINKLYSIFGLVPKPFDNFYTELFTRMNSADEASAFRILINLFYAFNPLRREGLARHRMV